jgi:NAD(P)H-hydrate epimerase
MDDGTVRLKRKQVREVDRRAIEEYHVPGIVLMENAAIEVAAIIFTGLSMVMRRGWKVIVVCGGGNNGGDGLAVARHLRNQGKDVRILLTVDPSRYQGDALINWRIVQAMQLPVAPFNPLDESQLRGNWGALIVDAIFGTGLTEAPREPFGTIVKAIQECGHDVLSIDVPSGLDCDTGLPLGPCVRANHTVTFVAEKAGFANPESKKYTGEVAVADIGCPKQIIDEVLRDLPA